VSADRRTHAAACERRAIRRASLCAVWILALLALVACAGRAPDPERGRQLFGGEITMPGGNLACIECHPVAVGEISAVMGQNLSNIGGRAAETVPGQSAEEYLRLAIVDPDTYLSGGFQDGIHPRAYKDALSDADVADLVAYMLTLQSGQD
jgi:cytochrome c553